MTTKRLIRSTTVLSVHRNGGVVLAGSPAAFILFHRLESYPDHSRRAAQWSVLFTRQGKFPINKLQQSSQLAIFLLKILDPEPQRHH
jgi:hypothetical protein